jgi:hypothetical protein
MVYVDAVLFDALTGISLSNRVPEPNDVQAPRATPVVVEISAPGDTVSLAATSVYVGTLLAFTAGTVQTGFTGGHTFLEANQVLRIELQPDDLFDSLEVVPVRVVSASVTAGAPLDETYTFTAEDQTPADFVSAIARDESTVRVTWDEDVLQVDPAGATDALNPANWRITAIAGFPAVSLVVASVITVSGQVVDLVTDIPMTPRATYQIEAVGVADQFGNALTGLWSDPGYWIDDDENEEEWG